MRFLRRPQYGEYKYLPKSLWLSVVLVSTLVAVVNKFVLFAPTTAQMANNVVKVVQCVCTTGPTVNSCLTKTLLILWSLL